MNKIFYIAGLACMLSLSSCMKDGDETILVENGVATDIPSDKDANPNPSIDGYSNTNIPNAQYTTVSEDGAVVIRLDMTGVQNKETLEYLRLYGTGDQNQNIWLEIDGKPKGIKVYNTIDDAQGRTVPVDLVFLVDNSGSMDDEADAIARDITSWTASLAQTNLDIRFAVIGFDGRITGGLPFTTAEGIDTYLNERGRYGTGRTVGFISPLNASMTNSYNGEDCVESAMAALRSADEHLSFRSNANRIYVNFTDEGNTPPRGLARFSVESLKTDWDTSRGTIHTVFSGGSSETETEYNHLMSDYTGGTVLYTNGSFSGVTLESLPITGAMRNSYIIRFTNVEEYLDGRPHIVKITIVDKYGNVQAEREFTVVFQKEPTEGDDAETITPGFNGGFGDPTGFGETAGSGTNVKKKDLVGRWETRGREVNMYAVLNKNGTGECGYINNGIDEVDGYLQNYEIRKDGHLWMLWTDDDTEWEDAGFIELRGNTIIFDNDPEATYYKVR